MKKKKIMFEIFEINENSDSEEINENYKTICEYKNI
jgi:hypothetical protein